MKLNNQVDATGILIHPITGIEERPDTQFTENDIVQAFSLLSKYDILLFSQVEQWPVLEN